MSSYSRKAARTMGTMLILSLSACAVGPDYHRPGVPVPRQYQESAGWTQAQPADGAPKGDWWTAFDDPLINQLEPMVAVSNQTVRQSYENYRQALAQVEVARSQLFPTIGLTASGSRSGGPASVGADGTRVAGTTTPVNGGSLELTASWVPDIWGKVRRTIEQNAATAQADEATLANATLSEQTLLAQTIINLRYADASIDLEQRAVDEFTESLRVVRAQGEAGITAAPPSAVIEATVALESAQATLIGLGVARAQYAHAIAVLVGRNPEDLDLPHDSALPTLPVVPMDVPGTLLQRRPDIAVAERMMAAQNAAVGVAVAAYYPTVSLSAAAGFSQSPLDGLLRSANRLWSLGADGSETLLDFGARHGEVRAAKAAYEAAVANYRGTVLSAFEAVENDLAGLRILASQGEALDRAVNDANRGAQVALAEFQAGTVDYTTVASAQEAQVNDQQSALNVQLNRLQDAVSLIGDLGGGWDSGQLASSR
jgi:NodT family efflux transporter outer membrane factor (OMF) lipoprotein